MSCDLSGQVVVENQADPFEFSQLFKFSTTVDRELAKWVTLFFGPSLNVNAIQYQGNEGIEAPEIGLLPIYNSEFVGGRLDMSIGARAGFRF